MNREIKFRGKSEHTDEWCFGSLVNYGDGEMEQENKRAGSPGTPACFARNTRMF